MSARRTEGSLLSFAITMALFFSFTAILHAATPDFDFYKGKAITYIVATKPGGGYDIYARLIGKYMEKYIPNSTVTVKNVAGAGHILGANETFLAKPDGLTIGTFNTGLVYAQLMGQKGIKFDLTKFRYVGKANSITRVFLVSAKSPYKSIKDVIGNKEPMKMACASLGNDTIILGHALDANIKPVFGYAGKAAELAIMRGEASGTTGSYDGLADFIRSKECRVLLQIAGKKHKDMPDVPLYKEINISAKGKKILAIIAGNDEIGRLTATAPNVPAGRLEVLRNAYKKALTDPAFLKDAREAKLDIDPDFGDAVEKLIKDVMNQPEENKTLLKNLKMEG